VRGNSPRKDMGRKLGSGSIEDGYYCMSSLGTAFKIQELRSFVAAIRYALI
jgi:hypothetical protein